jgi:type I restriction enzyme S subunit
LTSSERVIQHLAVIAEKQTAYPSVTAKDVGECTVVIPPLPEQRAIARVLGTLDDEIVSRMGQSKGLRRVFDHLMRHLLDGSWSVHEGESWLREVRPLVQAYDDKIELNRRMNQTLEEICRALFKFWFVDFGPVRAKAEGRWKKGESLPGMPADMWDFWPSEFEESEIGEIPKGWRVGSIYEIAVVRYGAPYASGLFAPSGMGRPLIRIRDLQTHAPEIDTTERHPRDVTVQGGDVIVGMDGEFHVSHWTGPTSVLNQRLCKFEPKSGIPTSFVRYSIEGHIAFFERAKVGTTVVHLGKAEIDTMEVLFPTRAILEAYGRIAGPHSNLIVSNAAEVRSLGETRDVLLPKLLSGEIRVKVDS